MWPARKLCAAPSLQIIDVMWIAGEKSVRNVPVIDESDEARDTEGDRQCERELQFAVLPPKYPAMSVMSRRAETFLTWPTGLDRQPAELIQAGLFYSGMKFAMVQATGIAGAWQVPVAMLCLLYTHLPGTRHSRGLAGATAKIYKNCCNWWNSRLFIVYE